MVTILNFCKHYENNKKKKAVIYNTLVSFFKNLNDTGTVNIPYFIRARDLYNEIIKSNKDVDLYYNQIIKNTNTV